ncbi:MAG: hypothetical protein ACLP4V_02395 [Methylocella sp.]
MSADEYYTGSILGVKVPLDGLNRDHVEWCWPGTITQSAEQAIFGEAEDAYNGANLLDKESTQIPPKTYRINALSFDDVFDGGTWFPALVVKPCPHLETPDVTKALGQIANEAMKIYGHYSFHCYSQALDGGVADFFGPPRSVVDAQPDWDSVNLKWKDWSDPSQIKWISAPFTVPAVCSSLARFIHLGFDFGLAGVA